MGRGFESLPRYHRDRHPPAGGVGRFFSLKSDAVARQSIEDDVDGSLTY